MRVRAFTDRQTGWEINRMHIQECWKMLKMYLFNCVTETKISDFGYMKEKDNNL